MESFSIRYSERAVDGMAVGTNVRLIMRICGVLMIVAAVAFLALPAFAGFSDWVYGAAAALAAVSGTWMLYSAFLVANGRHQPPPVAVSMDPGGITVWPLVAGDLRLPWEAVEAITVNDVGFGVLPRADVSVETPGVVGAAATQALPQARRTAGLTGGGIPWVYVEPVDPARFEAAVAHFSAGRVPIRRLDVALDARAARILGL